MIRYLIEDQLQHNNIKENNGFHINYKIKPKIKKRKKYLINSFAHTNLKTEFNADSMSYILKQRKNINNLSYNYVNEI